MPGKSEREKKIVYHYFCSEWRLNKLAVLKTIFDVSCPIFRLSPMRTLEHVRGAYVVHWYREKSLTFVNCKRAPLRVSSPPVTKPACAVAHTTAVAAGSSNAEGGHITWEGRPKRGRHNGQERRAQGKRTNTLTEET